MKRDREELCVCVNYVNASKCEVHCVDEDTSMFYVTKILKNLLLKCPASFPNVM